MEVFKIIKIQSPISLFQLLNLSKRNHKYTLNQPKVKLDKTMQNFLYSTSAIWNNLIEKPLKGSPLRVFKHKYYIQNIK